MECNRNFNAVGIVVRISGFWVLYVLCYELLKMAKLRWVSEKENQMLKSIRDSLLLKLMMGNSGKLLVENQRS